MKSFVDRSEESDGFYALTIHVEPEDDAWDIAGIILEYCETLCISKEKLTDIIRCMNNVLASTCYVKEEHRMDGILSYVKYAFRGVYVKRRGV